MNSNCQIREICTSVCMLSDSVQPFVHKLAQCTVDVYPPVLPSPQRQNMPNCVSDNAKQDKNMPNSFRIKTNSNIAYIIGSKFFHPIIKFTAQLTIHITHFKAVYRKESFPSKESDTRMGQRIYFTY